MDNKNFQNYEFHPCDNYCSDCIHRGSYSKSTNRTLYYCNYILDKGHSRQCACGEGCIAKEVGNMDRRRLDEM